MTAELVAAVLRAKLLSAAHSSTSHSDAHALRADLVEGLGDKGVELVELALHLVSGHDGWEELHRVDLIHDIAILLTREVHLNLGHGELLLGALLGVNDDTNAALVEHDDGLHHAQGLVEWAIVVVIGERVLLEELILDNLGGLHREKRKHAKGH